MKAVLRLVCDHCRDYLGRIERDGTTYYVTQTRMLGWEPEGAVRVVKGDPLDGTIPGRSYRHPVAEPIDGDAIAFRSCGCIIDNRSMIVIPEAEWRGAVTRRQRSMRV